MAAKIKEWSRDGFLLSTDPALIPIPALNAAFASEDLYWAKALPEDQMKRMVEGSLCVSCLYPGGREEVHSWERRVVGGGEDGCEGC